MQKQKGQSLVEVIIALGVLVVIVVGFTNLILTSVQNTQYARRQEEATQYARNAIELVRVVRDQNLPVTKVDGSVIAFSDLFTADFSGTNNCYIIEDNFPDYQLIQANCTDPDASTEVINNLYRRKIILSQPEAEIIRVYAEAVWTDNKGDHQGEIITDLSRWQ